MNDIPILEVQGLSKRFGGVQALADGSFRVRPGRILGIIGPTRMRYGYILSLVDAAAHELGAIGEEYF